MIDKKPFLETLLRFLQDEKNDLEKKGFIPTLEAAIEDIQEQINHES